MSKNTTWSLETMFEINRIASSISNAFDPDWFKLRERLESYEHSHNTLKTALTDLLACLDSGTDAMGLSEAMDIARAALKQAGGDQ